LKFQHLFQQNLVWKSSRPSLSFAFKEQVESNCCNKLRRSSSTAERHWRVRHATQQPMTLLRNGHVTWAACNWRGAIEVSSW